MLLQIGGEFSGTGHLFFRRRSRQRYIRRNGAVRPGRRYVLPKARLCRKRRIPPAVGRPANDYGRSRRSEEHTSELQSLMRNSYAVFCLKKKKQKRTKKKQ